jgi:hypothetical protein
MSVVRSNNNAKGTNSLLRNLGSVIAAALNAYPGSPYNDAVAAGKFIGTALKNRPRPGGVEFNGGGALFEGNGRSDSGRSGRTRRRGRGKERRANNNNNDQFRQIGMGPTSGVPNVRTRMTGVLQMTTTAAGALVWKHALGYENGNATNLFPFLSSDSVRLLGAFEKAVVHSVTLSFVGTQPNTTSGWIAIGMDSSTDMSIALPSQISDLTNASQNVAVGDLKGEISLRYVPKGTDREIRLLDTSANATEKYAGRSLIMIGGSNITTAVGIGLLQIAVDITLSQ